MLYAQRPLKVGKTTRYSYTLDSEALAGESVTSHTVSVDALVILGTTSVTGNTIYFYLTGVAAGNSKVELEWSTATTSDCADIGIQVEDC